MADMQPDRLAEGGRIDRLRPLAFTFNGRSFGGYAGDSLASALLANGVRVVGRSFKYHRPRGIVGSGPEEPNGIVQVGTGAATTPNVRATELELHDGLIASTVKGWPSLDFDLMAVTDWFHRLLVAGFYNKTFMRPRALWNFYEHFIRRAAGLGVAPELPDPDDYVHCNAHCDVLVAGAGPAGLMAALAAARCGARVMVADERSEPGGSLLHETSSLNGGPACEWLEAVLDELSGNPDVNVLPRSTVFGYHDHNFLTVLERCREGTIRIEGERAAKVRQRLWRVRANRVVLATGACERPLVFPNNDRPGIMLASAVSEYIHRYAVRPGKRAVVYTNNDSGYRTALDLAHAGVEAMVVDCRSGGAGRVADVAAGAGIEVRAGYAVSGVAGRMRVRSAEVLPLSGNGGAAKRPSERVACDLVAMAGGWSPVVHLHSQAGGNVIWSESLGCFVPGEPRQDNVSAGSAAGTWELGACLEEGRAAGLEAARRCGFGAVAAAAPRTDPGNSNPSSFFWRTPSSRAPERAPKQFVDYQNDTTLADIRLAVREGFHSVEHVKRYTALGFGTDQGKLGNVNGFAALAQCLNVPVGTVGATTFRPAYTPVAFGACAGMHVGELYDPVRKTALHEWHEAAGAGFEVVGQWLRPWYFPDPGEDMHTAVARECRAARDSLAIMDASTLGKIEVRGPDAVRFLERIYTHRIGSMKDGRCAYGIMLGEDGMVLDDGVTARLGEDHYYLTTTTGGAAAVLSWLEWWLQTEWPELKVYLTSVTDRWSTIALAGPYSRKLLEGLDSDIAFRAADFPFMSLRTGRLAGLPVRIFRVSFSGELAFEINVDSDCAMALWELLMEAGRPYGIVPYGTEAMHVLRAEKGFVIVGQDTDGSVTPVDLGMNWLLAKDKDYLGKRSLQRPDCLRRNRQQWVGLLSEDGSTVLPEGAQLVEEPGGSPPVPLLGHVTSSYRSACLGHPIALGLVSGGRARRGETIYAALRDGRFVKVKVTSSVFYDPKGERQRV